MASVTSPEARLAALAVGHACGYKCEPQWAAEKAAEVPKAAPAKAHGELQVELTKVGAEYGGIHAMETAMEGVSDLGAIGLGVGVAAAGAAVVGAAYKYDTKTAMAVGVKAAAGASKPVFKKGMVHASGVAASAAMQSGIAPGAAAATALAAGEVGASAPAAGTGAEGAAEGAGAAAEGATTGSSTAADAADTAATEAAGAAGAEGAATGAGAAVDSAGATVAESAATATSEAAETAGATAGEAAGAAAAEGAATGATAAADAAGATAADAAGAAVAESTATGASAAVDAAGATATEATGEAAAESAGSLLDDALLPAALAVAAVASVGCVVAYPVYYEGTARDCTLSPGPLYKGSIKPTEPGQTKFLLLTEEGSWNVRWYAYKDERTAMLAATSLYCSRILFDVSRFGHFEEVSCWGAARPHPTIRKGLEKMKEIAKKHFTEPDVVQGQVIDEKLQSIEPRKMQDGPDEEEPVGESATASGESADEEASALGVPTGEAEWMWADVGLGGYAASLARSNPLRWSSRRSVQETLKNLRQHLHSPSESRPVLVKVYRTDTSSGCAINQDITLTANSVAEAIASLNGQTQGRN